MSERWRAGRIAFTLALMTLAYMGVLAFVLDGLGLVVPLIPPFAILYWVLGLAAVGCAVAALIKRQWLGGGAALVLILASLVPSATILYECSRGNCL